MSVVRLEEVEAGAIGQNRAAHTVPVKPPPEVPLRQPLARHGVSNDHVRQIEASDAGRARAEMPFALGLTAQRARHASESPVEEAGAFEDFTAIGDVDAE